jgi:predicted CxxxxCH...CXXCH cytochrome family protein
MKLERILTALAIGSLAFIAGCSDLKTDLPSPVAPGVQVHQKDWVDTTSANFHGKVVDAAHGNVTECLNCHGSNYQGGNSGVSCVKCHQNEGASLHGKGWIDPASPNFHGNAIRSASWDMRPCQSCHGALYDGGKVGVSCRECHTGAAGPENCSTCHGSPTSVAPPSDLNGNMSRSAPGVGAHQIHLRGSSLSGTLLCTQCHTTPGGVYDPGHISGTNRASVHFNEALANTVTNEPGTQDYDAQLPTYHPSTSYDGNTLKCSNAYCHGNFKNGNQSVSPTWNDTTGTQAACGTCHGDVNQSDPLLRAMPKSTAQGGTHPDLSSVRVACAVCHGDVVAGTENELARIINPAKHVNGKLNVFGEERDY